MPNRVGRASTVLTVTVLVAIAIAGGAVAAIVVHHSTGVVKTTVNATESDFMIMLDQQSVPVGTVKFVVTNMGAVDHRFVVKRGGVTKQIKTLIHPGATKTLSLAVKKGKYAVICSIHSKMGMKTTLYVGVSSPTTSTGTTATSATTYTRTTPGG